MFCVYLHIPFCKKVCDYCDFRVMPAQPKLYEGFTDTICKQIAGRPAGDVPQTPK